MDSHVPRPARVQSEPRREGLRGARLQHFLRPRQQGAALHVHCRRIRALAAVLLRHRRRSGGVHGEPLLQLLQHRADDVVARPGRPALQPGDGRLLPAARSVARPLGGARAVQEAGRQPVALPHLLRARRLRPQPGQPLQGRARRRGAPARQRHAGVRLSLAGAAHLQLPGAAVQRLRDRSEQPAGAGAREPARLGARGLHGGQLAPRPRQGLHQRSLLGPLERPAVQLSRVRGLYRHLPVPS
mmetsp:Transcript_134071/g.373674  ORF Transcript_134071/g.373674 Transcript_134071/m.373674 type:complete len:243 (+) Transcript_134071:359-1087(+)